MPVPASGEAPDQEEATACRGQFLVGRGKSGESLAAGVVDLDAYAGGVGGHPETEVAAGDSAVAASVGRLGVVLAYLALDITAVSSQDIPTVRGAYAR
ncbi:hypothetical protein F0344_03955 [Streptomyces finlayi]|uniref:Uncharacterized protein n=1 Tax=Streptomyces finlayi TaxID=67296 RepID=A0A7G7BEV1_9ACTN|nr:hypothetical protein [Streptomyces finlayi]QNE73866.1 hypothetical protein F0344_03955 [Streptomyces finlayi]